MRIRDYTLSNGEVVFIAPPLAAKRQLFCILYQAIAQWFDPSVEDFAFVREVVANDDRLVPFLKENAHGFYYLLETFILNLNRIDRTEPIVIDSLSDTDVMGLLAIAKDLIEIKDIPSIRYPEIPKSKKDGNFDPSKYLQSTGSEDSDLLGDLWVYGLGDRVIDLYNQFDLETLLQLNYRVRQNTYLNTPELREYWKDEEIKAKAIVELDKFLDMIKRGEINDEDFKSFGEAANG